jgi:NitT/TauT family transport system substrate-binding protein
MTASRTGISRRTFLGSTAAIAATMGTGRVARAADKLTYLTSWYAQAEHGGFYQAKATGLYEKAGLDVTVRMGGPQVNGLQLLLAGEVDGIMGYDIQVLKALEQGMPAVTIGTSFQYDLQGMLTHDDVASLGELKNKTILVATGGRTTWWPWLKKRFGYSDEQTKPYTFNLQPFFADKNVVQQAYPSSEPFQAIQQNIPHKFFLFANDGYPPYGTTLVTTRPILEAKPDVLRRFVAASLQGWKSYIENPEPANVLIKEANPKMSDAQIAFGVKRMKELKVLDGGDAAQGGIGIMTEARWKQTYDYLVEAGLLKPEVDWRKAFTTDFVKDLKIQFS